jgi:predicted class III extradiol MEMO1 family dioxygenase
MNGENRMSATKFLKDTLLAYEESQRQTGRTTRAVMKAIADDAVLVVHNHDFKHYMLRDHGNFGLKCITIDEYTNKERYRGKRMEDEPRYIFDHFAEYVLIKRRLREIEFIMSEEYKYARY